MSDSELEDKAGALNAALEAYVLGPTEAGSKALADIVFDSLPEGSFEVFLEPARGADNHRVMVRLSESFHLHIAGATEKGLGIARAHGLAPAAWPVEAV